MIADFILIGVLTACGTPVANIFFDADTHRVLRIEVNSQEERALSLEILSSHPLLETDLLEYAQVNCA